MTNVRDERGGKTIIKAIFIIFLLLIMSVIAAIALQIYRKVEQEKKNREYIQNYPNEIRTYLYDKYGKSFYINPKYETYPGGPIPGRSYTPYIYEIHEEDVNGYVFNVRISPESTYDNKIKEIQDNYCWKYLNIMTKEWFRNEMTEFLPQEYKFILHSMYSNSYFDHDKNIKPNVSLEAYYKTRTRPVSLTLHIVIPPNVIRQNIEDSEENLKKVINGFYKNNPNSRIEFFLSQAKARRDYDVINERALENTRFFVHREWENLRDIAEIGTILKIKVGQRD